MNLLNAHIKAHLAGYIVLLCLPIVILLASLYQSYSVRDVQVVLTENGFVPNTIVIKKGQAIVFSTDTGEAFWPASDSHPTHRLYPEFDPKAPIAASSTWRFVFKKAGVWEFHDHLAANFTGRITVLGGPGEASAACLKDANGRVKAYCWSGEMSTLIQQKGLDAGFDSLVKLYQADPMFRENCHDVTHAMGVEAYKIFDRTGEISERPETSYCGYGFFHGMIEEMIILKGPSQLREARRYCEAIATSSRFASRGAAQTASAACYHGLGHALFDSVDGGFWGSDSKMAESAISSCEKILDAPESRSQCASGVFNSLAIAESGGTYELSFSKTDPTAVCRMQKKLYQDSCFKEIGVGYIRQEYFDRAQSLHFILSLRDADAIRSVIFAYFADEVRFGSRDLTPAELSGFCTPLSFTPSYEQACVRGVAGSLIDNGLPGAVTSPALKFCDTFSTGSTLRMYCFDQTVSKLRGVLSEKAIEDVCVQLKDEPRVAACEQGR